MSAGRSEQQMKLANVRKGNICVEFAVVGGAVLDQELEILRLARCCHMLLII